MNTNQPTASPERKNSLALRVGLFTVLLLVVSAGATIFIPKISPGGINLPGVVTVTPGSEPTGVPTNAVGQIIKKGEQFDMSIRLSEGQAQPNQATPLPLAVGEPLSPDQIAQILSRLPTLPPAPDEQVDFKFPLEALPPPRPGQTIHESFPPILAAPTPDVAASGPLQVLRFAPEGEIPIAPFVSITFNQSMVPLGTIKDLAAAGVPVVIEPAIPGTWRWLGTRTLTFQSDSTQFDRLPKATQYHVSVPAGTKSVGGGVLSQAVTWTFTTPAPKVTISYPYDSPQPLTPIFFVAFDQRIDPQAVLQTTRVLAGTRAVSVVLAGTDEIAKDEQVSSLVKNAMEGRWLAFRATQPLPASTTISVTIGPGTPSAEGPLLTNAAQSFSFPTYSPLVIEDHGCSWYDNICRPLTPFSIRFNNPINPDIFPDAAQMLRIDPAIPGLSVNVYGNSLEINGETRGQTTYKVIVSKDVQDVFGQKLGSDTTLTFKVDSAEALLVNSGQNFITLDPSAPKPVFSVYAINYASLKVKIYAVQPGDWPDFKQYLAEWQRTDITPHPMPGKLVSDRSQSLNLPGDTLSQVDISLSEFMQGSTAGQFVVIVEPPKPFFEDDNAKWRRISQTVISWVQVTQIGLDAFTDPSDMLAWATNLKDGSPLVGVNIQPGGGSGGGVTGADGVARFAIPSGATYLIAKLGADQAILPRSAYYWGDDGWQVMSQPDTLRWYIFDDRGMYRPGEDVHIKGWLRRIGGGQNGDVGLLNSAVSSVSYEIRDPQNNVLFTGQQDVNSLGGFDFSVTLPQGVNLGAAQVTLTAQGALGSMGDTQGYHNFQIQEFRRPEFEVTARNETTGPYFVGGNAVVALQASYYAGGALPNADVNWLVTSTPTNYSPPNWPDFSFGTWKPWWNYVYDSMWGGPIDTGGKTESFVGKTDSSGNNFLRLDFDQLGDPAEGPRPFSVLAQGTVMDVNRQAWSGETTLMVHPADVYVGLRSARYFVEQGTPLEIDFIVPDLDGKPQVGIPVVMRAARLEWKYVNKAWQEQEVDIQTCNMASAATALTCSFETKLGGSYKITAVVTDSLGRLNQSSLTRWVSGGKQPPARKVEMETVTLVPDKETYQPGDVAHILVLSPFSPAEGLLTVSRSGILYTQRFKLDSGSLTLDVPVEQRFIPNLNIQVDLVGSAPRTDDQGTVLPGVEPRPAYASGSLNLSIPPLARTLSLQVSPDMHDLEPGGSTTLNVVLKDARGAPVSDAELAVVVVDDAILALSNYQMLDPVSVFYETRPSDFYAVYGRASIILADPQALARTAGQKVMNDGLGGGAPMATASPAMEFAPSAAPQDSRAAAGQQPAIRVRSDFNPLALFAPTVRTDSSGNARIPVTVPDNLTRYRIMVVAVDSQGSRFGSGEATLTARLALMVRPSAPRFLNFGDRFELPVVLQNQTSADMTVDLAARASNLEFDNAAIASTGLRVTVPANNRIEVRLPARTHMAGTARVQFAAVSGTYEDAATIELPVYTPATSESFATYGVIDNGAIAQPVQSPSGVFPQYGGLEVNTSSTALQALTDAVLYLVTYPYQCSEQLASRILAVASLRDVLTAFKADGLPTPEEMAASVGGDIDTLKGLQNDDGGFPYWRRGFDSSPFNTIHVAHALVQAQQKGFSVPTEMQQNALNYLRQIEDHYPGWYDKDIRWTLSAYALYVRNLSGERDNNKALLLIKEAGLENLSLEAIGWLWPVVDDQAQLDAIRRFVNNHVVETAGAANFTTAYSDQTYLLLSSDRRTDAILLDAMIGDNPKSDLIAKVVNGLLAHRSQGRWDNTQENVFVLLALDKYFNTYESQTPDFAASLWMGSTYAGSTEFRGRSTDRFETLIPMSNVLAETGSAGGSQNLILSKDGAGRLYYRFGLRYAPTDLNLKALDMGFVVQRSYEGVDNPADVTKDSSGAWVIKAGARVRVRIQMVADNRRYHVALVDPLPAGLEIINPGLEVSGSTPQDPNTSQSKYGWWWWGTWYEHQNMRDNRAEAFTSLLWDGVYDYSYIARATTPGTFIVPPSKAEEMYSPEVFGRSASDWVIVK